MGYLAVGFTIGIAAKNTGLDAVQSFFMSLGMVASAGEYAALMLIGAGAGLIEMVATTLVINLRYLLMSCSLTQKLRPEEPFWKRFLLALCVTDELFGISSAVPGALNPVYTWGAMLVSVTGWCLGTVLGVEAGNILPARAASAMNVALYGMFLAIILPPAKRSRFMGGLIAAAMLSSWLFSALPGLRQISAGFRVILLTVALSSAAAWLRPVDGQGRPVRGERTDSQEERV
ncbi:AzlC family ABC transporter permease [Lachnoclostridium sp. Marseille-P6806]|uniref:AzlC family ABC transporter permease n=1 Tax=Lachnoclostridium sp. Marseille-P6806 TaxID=2364793 RepID=UPI002FE69567